MSRGTAGLFTGIRKLQLCIAALLLTTGSATSDSLEYAVKATYLYKFLPFVVWPSSSFSSPESPINICIYGKDPFGQLLDQAVAGQHIDGRAILVRRISEISANSGCHIVYLGASPTLAAMQGLDILRDQPVLTVSDSSANSAAHGIINFVVEDNKVRFQIDEHTAELSHLAVSSKLLSLAYQGAK